LGYELTWRAPLFAAAGWLAGWLVGALSGRRVGGAASGRRANSRRRPTEAAEAAQD